jgi:hypothetical protein
MQETQQAHGVSIIDLPTTTFQVVQSSDIVTDEWLTRADVEPHLEQNQEGVFILSIINQGEFGMFEVPYIFHQLVHADESLVVVLVAYHGTEPYGRKSNKRVTKGQFWRYYQCDDNGVWCQVIWKQLNESERQIVLAAKEEKSPAWAKVPGKLQAEYGKPGKAQTRTMSYKIVRVIDGRYYSIYKPDEEYELGKMKVQQAKPKHRGGYFSYPDAELIMRVFEEKHLFSYRYYTEPMTVALLECEIGGRMIEYNNGKWASTYLRPLRVLGTLEYSPN